MIRKERLLEADWCSHSSDKMGLFPYIDFGKLEINNKFWDKISSVKFIFREMKADAVLDIDKERNYIVRVFMLQSSNRNLLKVGPQI